MDVCTLAFVGFNLDSGPTRYFMMTKYFSDVLVGVLVILRFPQALKRVDG